MKRIQIITAILGTAMLFTNACKKDIEEMNHHPLNTSSNGALANFIAQHAPPVQSFTFNASTGGMFYGTDGAVIYVSPNAFVHQNNIAVTGTVTLNIQEVYTKSDIIFSGAFTTANGLPLISGGEINVTAYQGTQELKLAYSESVYVTIPTIPGAPAMSEFGGSAFGADRDFIQVDSPAVVIVTDSSSTSYGFGLDSLDWTNCDQYMSIFYNTGPMTEFSISVPTLFDSENSFVLVTSSYANYASRIWDYDEATHTFLCNYYRLPVGMDFTFTIVSEINGTFYYASQTVTIEQNQAVSLVPQVMSEAQVEQNILGL
jgi:hypothetical protein